MTSTFEYFQPVYREAGFGLSQYESATIHIGAIQ